MDLTHYVYCIFCFGFFLQFGRILLHFNLAVTVTAPDESQAGLGTITDKSERGNILDTAEHQTSSLRYASVFPEDYFMHSCSLPAVVSRLATYY